MRDANGRINASQRRSTEYRFITRTGAGPMDTSAMVLPKGGSEFHSGNWTRHAARRGVRGTAIGERPEHEWNYQEEKQLAIDAAKEEARQAEALAAQNSVLDFTRKSQRKRERELTVLQFIGDGFTALQAQPVIAGSKAGRNDICPCGSGKKYKKCHGA